MRYKIVRDNKLIAEEKGILSPAQIEKYERENYMMFIRIDLFPDQTVYVFERYKPELYKKKPWEMN